MFVVIAALLLGWGLGVCLCVCVGGWVCVPPPSPFLGVASYGEERDRQTEERGDRLTDGDVETETES